MVLTPLMHDDRLLFRDFLSVRMAIDIPGLVGLSGLVGSS
jgi:hypothetical protein